MADQVDEVLERARDHLRQFRVGYPAIKGFLFVGDEFLAGRVKGKDYVIETDPDIIDHVKKTWVGTGEIGKNFSPAPDRPHCIITLIE